MWYDIGLADWVFEIEQTTGEQIANRLMEVYDDYMEKKNQDGLIAGGQHVTTEGYYTVAYPLAVIARTAKDTALAHIALGQLMHRTKYLSGTNAIYQRSTLKHEQTYRNWGRGVAWSNSNG